MPQSFRTAALADRHRALGAEIEDWNGLPTAVTYTASGADQHQQHEAIRTKAGLMDVSGLKIINLVGPHAEHVLDLATTRNMRKMYQGKAVYTTLLDERGMLVDDGIIYRTGVNSWMLVHGTGAAHEQIVKEAVGHDVEILFDNDQQILSLQGPLAVDFLEQHVSGLRDLRYFHHRPAQLFDCPVMISRTGYTGERGYEIFCKSEDAGLLWDTILEQGASWGIIPVAFGILDMLRVESQLIFYPDDNSETHPFENDLPGDTLWELGLDFTVSPGKTGFRGASQHYHRQGKERFKIYGVMIDGEGQDPASGGDRVYDQSGNDVGVITAGMYSTLTKRSVALARLDVDQTVHGTPLSVEDAQGKKRAAIAHSLPFDDPEKKKRLARD